MKLRISIPFIITILMLGLFLLSSSSCSQKTYSSKSKVAYNRSDRIKSYKKPSSSRNSFNHAGPLKKKYVIKK